MVYLKFVKKKKKNKKEEQLAGVTVWLVCLVGEYAVRFIPRENGVHNVFVTFDGCDIPDSPFRILVGKVDADPGMVTASGDGLRTGQTGRGQGYY